MDCFTHLDHFDRCCCWQSALQEESFVMECWYGGRSWAACCAHIVQDCADGASAIAALAAEAQMHVPTVSDTGIQSPDERRDCLTAPWPMLHHVLDGLILSDDVMDKLALEYNIYGSPPPCIGWPGEAPCRPYQQLSELLLLRYQGDARAMHGLPHVAWMFDYASMPSFADCQVGATTMRLVHIYLTAHQALIGRQLGLGAPLAEEASMLLQLDSDSPWSPLALVVAARLTALLEQFLGDAVAKFAQPKSLLETLRSRSSQAWAEHAAESQRSSGIGAEDLSLGQLSPPIEDARGAHDTSGHTWRLCGDAPRSIAWPADSSLAGLLAVVVGASLGSSGEFEAAVHVVDARGAGQEACSNWPGTDFLRMGCMWLGADKEVPATILSGTSWTAPYQVRKEPPFTQRAASLVHCQLPPRKDLRVGDDSMQVQLSIDTVDIQLDLCLDSPPRKARLAVCTLPLYDIRSRPDVVLHWAEYHGSVLGASLSLYDLDGSLEVIRGSLPLQADVFSNWPDRLASPIADVSRGIGLEDHTFSIGDCAIALTEAHCLFRYRSSAEWVVALDPDEYLMVPVPGGAAALHGALDRVAADTGALYLGFVDFGGSADPNERLPPYARYLHRRAVAAPRPPFWKGERGVDFVPQRALCRPASVVSKHFQAVRLRTGFGMDFSDPWKLRVNHYVDTYSPRLYPNALEEDRTMLWALAAGTRCWMPEGSASPALGDGSGSEALPGRIPSAISSVLFKHLGPGVRLERFLEVFVAGWPRTTEFPFSERAITLLSLHRHGVRLEVESESQLSRRFFESDADSDGELSVQELRHLLDASARDAFNGAAQT